QDRASDDDSPALTRRPVAVGVQQDHHDYTAGHGPADGQRDDGRQGPRERDEHPQGAENAAEKQPDDSIGLHGVFSRTVAPGTSRRTTTDRSTTTSLRWRAVRAPTTVPGRCCDA